MSESYKGAITALDPSLLQSRTYYVGTKGDEIADYSENFKLGTEIIKTVSIFFYGLDRATTADPEQAMTKSENHKLAIDGRIESETYYLGEKSEEVASYSHNTTAS